MPRLAYFCFLGVSLLPGSFLFAQAIAADTSESSVYLLSPVDKLVISVYGQPDLSSEQRISDEGTVSIPLLGETRIGGMTVSKAQKLIEAAFVEQRYLVTPVVTISIEAFSPKVVTVLGEVEEPGSIAIPEGRNGLPIQVAIAEAGGFTGAAQKSEVQLKRAAQPGADPAGDSLVVNVSKLLGSKSNNKSAVTAGPDDVIFVPRRLF
jgi:polysaccharide export outer membrane protein